MNQQSEGWTENKYPYWAELEAQHCALTKVVEAQKAALALAASHIEHMAAFITEQNKRGAGYSFESLGEDMPTIRAALSNTGETA